MDMDADTDGSYLHPDLARAREIEGSQRFYPPGLHPATLRVALQERRILRLPDSPERTEILRYCRSRMAAFDEGETEAKLKYLTQMRP